MANAKEMVKEIQKLVAENINDQMDRLREQGERHAEQYKEMLEAQKKSHQEDTEALADQFERMRMEREKARGRQIHKLPQYDGVNLAVEEWEYKIEAVAMIGT